MSGKVWHSTCWAQKSLVLVVLLALVASASVSYASVIPDNERQQTSGTQIVLRARDGVHYDQETLQLAAEVIYMRVLPLNATVYVSPEGLVMVQFPPDSQESVVIEAIRSVGLLEFIDFSQVAPGQYLAGDCILTTEQVRRAESLLGEGQTPPSPVEYVCAANEPGAAPDSALLNGGQPFTTIMTGTGLADATAFVDGQLAASWMVEFNLKEGGEGVDRFLGYIGSHPNQAMGMVLDGRLLSYPTIQPDLASSARAGTMDGGIIVGDFMRDEAQVLAAQLRSGALPVPMDILDYSVFTTLATSSSDLFVGRTGLSIPVGSRLADDEVQEIAGVIERRFHSAGLQNGEFSIQVVRPAFETEPPSPDRIQVLVSSTNLSTGEVYDLVSEVVDIVVLSQDTDMTYQQIQNLTYSFSRVPHPAGGS